MRIRLLKLLISLLSAGFLAYIFYYTTPPKSWDQASIFQILEVFIPIAIFLTFLLDIFINYFPYSFLIALGALLLVALQANSELNIISGLIVILITALAVKLFPKVPLLRLRGIMVRVRKITDRH